MEAHMFKMDATRGSQRWTVLMKPQNVEAATQRTKHFQEHSRENYIQIQGSETTLTSDHANQSLQNIVIAIKGVGY